MNQRQTRWIIKLIVYNFKIFHRFDFKNFANELFKRFDYKEICSLNIKLLSILQNKLTLIINNNSLSQNKRKKRFSIIIDDKFENLSQSKRKFLIKLVFVFQLIETQIVVFRKIVNDVFEFFYKKSPKLLKFVLKNLQIENNFVIRFCWNNLTFTLNERFKSRKI